MKWCKWRNESKINRKGETGIRRASCICRDPADLCLDFLIFFFSYPKHQYFTAWDETQQSAIFLALLQTSQTNPTDSTLKSISLCLIMLKLSEVQLVCTEMASRNVFPRDTFYFFILQVHFQSLYSLTLTFWVMKSNLNFNFYQSGSVPSQTFRKSQTVIFKLRSW